jgi:hypothetical protein
MSKNIREVVSKISGAVSSGIIVDHKDYLSKNLIHIIKNKIKHEYNLKQMELNYLDFKRK